MTARVASGVKSREAGPVPPVVSIRSTFISSVKVMRECMIFSLSSVTISCPITSAPIFNNSSTKRGPLISFLFSVAPLSLTVMAAARILILIPSMFSHAHQKGHCLPIHRSSDLQTSHSHAPFHNGRHSRFQRHPIVHSIIASSLDTVDRSVN